MKAVSYAVLILYYSFNVHVLSLEHLKNESAFHIIKQCRIEQRFDKHVRLSAFVEEVNQGPVLIHMTEPIRVSIEAHISSREQTYIQGSWITWFVFEDYTSCYLRDLVKTETMERKSKNLHEQLQHKRINKSKHDINENNSFEKSKR